MLKIRLMGISEDIAWFRRVLRECPEIRVTEFSAMYPIKGSRRNHRVYVEVEHTEKVEGQEETYHV